MVGELIEDWFASAVIGRLEDEASSLLWELREEGRHLYPEDKANNYYLWKQFREEGRHLYSEIEDLFIRLQTTLGNIQALIDDGERELNRNPSQAILLRQLKNTLYDAEDVLDDFQIKFLSAKFNGKIPLSLEDKMESQNLPSYTKFFEGKLRSPFNFFKYLYRYDPQYLKNLVGKLESIFHAANTNSMLVAHPEKKMARVRETTSYMIQEDVVGREEEKEMIVKILLSSGGEPESRGKGRVGSSSGRIFDVLPLVGMGGVGKTTLAKLVYNDDGVKKRFDTRLWCYVSDNLDINRILKSLWLQLSDDHRFTISDISDIETVTVEVKLALSNKNILIVLDDVWIEEPRYWEKLRDIFTCGARGSKVVVTTRSELVADIVGTMNPIMVNLLSKNECWEIIKNLAFGVRHVKHEERKKLQQIGMQICEKAVGLPLAAKVLGDLLQTRLDEKSWRAILAGEWWELDFVSGGILPTLKLSYQHLNANLRECFAYCSIFPRGHEFEKQKLVEMWRAQGYIKLDDRKEKTVEDIGNRLEDIGSKWFDELKLGGFFKHVEGSRYVMHDLMRALAISVSLDDCFVVEDGSENIPYGVRHLTVMTDQLGALQEIREFKSLRTILFFANCDPQELSIILVDILDLTNLRVLVLFSTAMEEVVEKVIDTSHLRYLDASNVKFSGLLTPVPPAKSRLQVLYLQGYAYRNYWSLFNGIGRLQINPPNRHSLSPRTITGDDAESEILKWLP